jgi:hypothetical protein
LNGFDQLGNFYTKSKSNTQSESKESNLGLAYEQISFAVKGTNSTSKSEAKERVVPIQLTPQRLAEFLGHAECVWILEDFHKVNEDEKRRVSDMVKIFVDMANDYPVCRIICIGAVATARELIEYDSNLNTRVSEMFVPLMRNTEIQSIVDKGMRLLNLEISAAMSEKIVYYSNGLAAVCHQMCYDLCYGVGVRKTKLFRGYLSEDDFRDSVNAYVRKNSDTFVKLYDSISSEGIGGDVLRLLVHLDEDGAAVDRICGEMQKQRLDNESLVYEVLEKLSSSQYSDVLRFDRASHKYSISNPLFAAFLKMKYALEHVEAKERNRARQNQRRNKYRLKAREEMPGIPVGGQIWDEELLNKYYQYLDNYVIRTKEIEIRIRKSLDEESGSAS